MHEGIVLTFMLKGLKSNKELFLDTKNVPVPATYPEYNALIQAQKYKVFQAYQALVDRDATSGSNEIAVLKSGAIAASRAAIRLNNNTRQATTTTQDVYSCLINVSTRSKSCMGGTENRAGLILDRVWCISPLYC